MRRLNMSSLSYKWNFNAVNLILLFITRIITVYYFLRQYLNGCIFSAHNLFLHTTVGRIYVWLRCYRYGKYDYVLISNVINYEFHTRFSESFGTSDFCYPEEAPIFLAKIYLMFFFCLHPVSFFGSLYHMHKQHAFYFLYVDKTNENINILLTICVLPVT